MDCTTAGYFIAANNVCTKCYTGCTRCTGAGSDQCTECLKGTYYLQPSPNPTKCATTCPFGYETNDALATCVQCSSTQVWYNQKCLNSCPEGFVKTDSGGCGKCSDSNLMYFNHTCVSTCPLKTFRGFNTYINRYECISCSLGCDTCVDETSSGCLTCSEGFFYHDNFCNIGCPSDMYANQISRACEQCQPPCVTCSNSSINSCTSCLPGNFLLNGTCVASCPADYYQNFLGENEVFKVPTCVPKLILKFDLSLTTQARIIDINFNYGIAKMIQTIAQKIQIEIADTQINNVLFVLTPLTESRIQFGYLGDQSYPPYSLLRVTINLDTDDFNKNSYQQFRLVEKTATIQLKEIYSFSAAEKQFIESTSAATNAGGSTIASIQAVSSVAQGAFSTSLIRLQIVGEIVQLLRLVAIRWPPNVAEYFANSHIDPTSIMLPLDFMGALNGPLEDRNYSMPRVFHEYEIPPFFSQNYNNELSNLLFWASLLIGGSILLNLLKKGLKKVTTKMDIPKRYDQKKKCRYHLIKLIHKLSQLINRIEDSTLWNFLLIFTLSIYQPAILWSLINMKYDSALLEPSTTSTRTSLALGIIFFIFFLTLLGFVSGVLLKNMKYLVHTGRISRNIQQEERLKKYDVLIEDFHRNKRLQILFLPISLMKSFVFVAVLALMSFSPMAQIATIWGLSTAFVLYMVIYQPLKVRWMRIMTLIIELLTYGCVTLAFIFGIIERCVDLDATTSDEMGFVFIILTIASTLTGVLISLIQVLLLIKDIFQYLKDRITNQKRVQPMTISALSELQILAFDPTPSIEMRENKFKDKVIEASETFLKSNPLSPPKSKDLSEDEKMFVALRKLSPTFFERWPKGKQRYLDLKEWWNSVRSEVSIDTIDAQETAAKDRFE